MDTPNVDPGGLSKDGPLLSRLVREKFTASAAAVSIGCSLYSTTTALDSDSRRPHDRQLEAPSASLSEFDLCYRGIVARATVTNPRRQSLWGPALLASTEVRKRPLLTTHGRYVADRRVTCAV